MKNKFVLDPYFGELSDPNSLVNYIYAPIFLRTKIDVLYFDFLNWENHDLLDIDLGLGTIKTDYKKTAISFVQYVWIKMVEALIKYGFSYNDVKAIRKKLSKKLHYSFSSNQKIAQNKSLQTSDNYQEFYVTEFERYVFSTIANKYNFKFFFYKDAPEDYFVFDDSLFDMFIEFNEEDKLREKFNKDHFSFSFYKIFEPFLSNEIDTFKTKSISILSNEESKTLRMIRRNYNELKSITIRFKEAKPTHLEIKTNKKVSVESRIMEHIQKRDYSTIVIQTVDGSVVNFENTKKYKL
ncbi:hypothetical protein N9K85_02845 [Flavobacteriaceae bacterium]|nr:hypothetical protein [Flavobacteriaceae bacterium]